MTTGLGDYEWRFQEFCWAHQLDPEDTASAIEYEAWFEYQHRDERNDGGSPGWGYV